MFKILNIPGAGIFFRSAWVPLSSPLTLWLLVTMVILDAFTSKNIVWWEAVY